MILPKISWMQPNIQGLDDLQGMMMSIGEHKSYNTNVARIVNQTTTRLKFMARDSHNNHI